MLPREGGDVIEPRAIDVSSGATDAASWTSAAAPGATATVAADAGALRFDFALAGHGAWAITRRELAITLPPHSVVTLRIRGVAAPAELQVKLVDATGANVWWWRRDAFVPPRAVETIVLRRASLAFAWGPRSGGDPDRLGAVELAVASDAGAAGTWWIESLRIEPREAFAGPPEPLRVTASSCAPGNEPMRALEPEPSTSWCAAPDDPAPALDLDLGALREWGGLVVTFAGEAAPAHRVLASADGSAWTTLLDAPAGGAASAWLRTGEADARFVRLALGEPRPVSHVEVVPIELAVSPARWAAARAKAAPRGRHPRHLLDENAYWIVVGGDGDTRKGLLGADGALELDFEGQTVEPFLWTGERLLSWADVDAEASLVEGSLPIPSVTWRADGLRRAARERGDREAEASALVARYAVSNEGTAARRARLFLAVRPFQVSPVWQSLNMQGGIARIERLACHASRVRIDAARTVAAVSVPDGFGAAGAHEGLAALAQGALPLRTAIVDPIGFAEGAFAFDLALAPGASESIWIAAPLFDATPALPAGLARAEANRWGEARLAEATERWHARLAPIPLALPKCAAAFEESLRASIAWILVNREGPRIQPGPRCYRRSWIRDGTLTGTAIAEMGFAEEAKRFLRWYAPFQQADGFVPCAVDHRGVDRAIEHDSHGQLAWGVVELFRLTRDESFLRALWPHVLGAVATIERLRATRLGDAFRDDVRRGLLPESISHEGYASNPAHSYWDDLFAVRGLADAAWAAAELGDGDESERIAALCGAMRRDLHASIERSMAQHGIDFVPGAAELGDFDPTSTAIALDPCGEGERLPRAALERTFERYWQELDARRRGAAPNDAYTPYEVRNAVALLRLGWKARAVEQLAWLIGDQRIPPWRAWPEVTTQNPRAPRFLGDLPHGWVASSFVRSVRRLVVYEADDGRSLVLGAGLPEAWVRESPGVVGRGMPTHFGALDCAFVATGEREVRVALGGSCAPPGGVTIESPCVAPLREVVADGAAHSPSDPRRVRLASMPREVVLRY
jgi:hypothetical protein